MRLAKLAAICGVSLAAVGIGWAAPASAAGSFTLSVTNFTDADHDGNADTIPTIQWSGFPANTIVFIDQCKRTMPVPVGEPAFDWVNDCSNWNGQNPTSDATGSGQISPANGGNAFTPFVGDDPYEGLWSCGDSQSGVTEYDTCYIRLTPSTKTNYAESVFVPVTFNQDPEPIVPEVPVNVLLPLGAVGVIGGAALVLRRRQALAA